MVSTDPNIHYDYGVLVDAPLRTLLVELADAHSTLSNLHIRIAFLRQEELRGQVHAKEMRVEMEGLRDAFVEKKWLINKILEYHVDQ